MVKLREIMSDDSQELTSISIYDKRVKVDNHLKFICEVNGVLKTYSFEQFKSIPFREFSLYSFDKSHYTIYVHRDEYDLIISDLRYKCCYNWDEHGDIKSGSYIFKNEISTYYVKKPPLMWFSVYDSVTFSHNANVYELIYGSFSQSNRCSISINKEANELYLPVSTQDWNTVTYVYSCSDRLISYLMKLKMMTKSEV